MRRFKSASLLSLVMACAVLYPSFVAAQDTSVPDEYRRLFYKTSPKQGFWSKVGEAIGWDSRPYTRSYAIVAGIWEYEFDRLEMAEKDVRRLIKYLEHYESFDEIVVLANNDFNDANLRYFLQSYFPEQLRKHRGSRFLFGFSGHGTTQEIAGMPHGYLLLPTAKSLTDFSNAMNVDNLMTYASGVAEAKHTLFLLNSCFSGSALEIGGNGFDTSESINDLLRNPAFHVLTAGRANEKVIGSSVYSGSSRLTGAAETLTAQPYRPSTRNRDRNIR